MYLVLYGMVSQFGRMFSNTFRFFVFFSELSVLGGFIYCTAVALTGQNGFLITGLNSSKTDKQRLGFSEPISLLIEVKSNVYELLNTV